MSTRRAARPAFVAAIVTAGILLAGCTPAPTPSPTPTTSATVTPRPTESATPAPTATPTPVAPATPAPEPAPGAEPAAPAAYDLEAAYAICKQYAIDDLAGLTGTFKPFDPADTNPIAEEKINSSVADDPNALMMHVFWQSDTSDLSVGTFCSISGPFDAQVVTFERGASNA